MNILCIDAGTNNVKTQIYNSNGPITEVVKTPVEKSFNLKKGIIHSNKYMYAFKKCIKKLIKNNPSIGITHIGIIGIGPTLVIFSNSKVEKTVRNYNYQSADKGVKEFMNLNLYKERGIGTGSQYTPEQIIQLKYNNSLPEKPFFTTFINYLCHQLGSDINKWTYPEASYNGLLNINTRDYSKRIFKEFKFKKSWFPKLSTGFVGYLNNKASIELKIQTKEKIPIYNLGTDGPATQAYFGKEYSTFKIESTGAFRVKGNNPIFDSNPIVKGFPGVWNLFYKEPNGKNYFISGSTINAGVNTIKYYFPDITDNNLQSLDKELIKILKKGIPDLKDIGVELPFEYGERDGIKRKFGIFPTKPTSKIKLYYALKEGILFNMMQRIYLVRNAQLSSNNKLNDQFVITGPISYSKPWIDLALFMLNVIIGIKNPKSINSKYKEIGLASVAKGILEKTNNYDHIKIINKTRNLNTVSIPLNINNKKLLLKRWNYYNECYKRY